MGYVASCKACRRKRAACPRHAVGGGACPAWCRPGCPGELCGACGGPSGLPHDEGDRDKPSTRCINCRRTEDGLWAYLASPATKAYVLEQLAQRVRHDERSGR